MPLENGSYVPHQHHQVERVRRRFVGCSGRRYATLYESVKTLGRENSFSKPGFSGGGRSRSGTQAVRRAA
jgi:hypothetical protein